MAEAEASPPTLPDFTPTRRTSLSVWRSTFAGESVYGIQDEITGRIHRLDPREYRVYCGIRDDRTLAQSFLGLVAHGILEPNSEKDFFAFVEKIHQLNLIGLPIDDGNQRYETHCRLRAKKARSTWLNFLFLQVPLVSPDRFLTRTVDYVRWMFGKVALSVWAIAMIACAALVSARWQEITNPLLDLVSLENLPILVLVLVGLKVVHELGHAYACKAFGGRVPEMGTMLVCLAPLAYVDASSSWSFRRKHRIAVGMAGMYFESWLGALCLLVWATTGASLINTVAYQAFVLATVTTVAFNLNPLMRFDGYYVVSDILDLPNMRQRGQAVVKRWFNRSLLRMDDGTANPETRWRRLLACYGISASVYKVFMVLGICTLIATQFYWIGLTLAAYYVLKTVVGWIWGGANYLLFAQETAPARGRSIAMFATSAVSLTLLIGAVPIPAGTTVTGLIGFEREQLIRSRVDGNITTLTAHAGDRVQPQDAIATLANWRLLENRDKAQTTHEVTQLELEQASKSNHIEAAALTAREQYDRTQRQQAEQQVAKLHVTAEQAGKLLWTLPPHDLGAFLPAGSEVALVGSGQAIAKFLVSEQTFVQSDIEFGTQVTCRSAGSTTDYTGRIISIASIADHRIEDRALTQTSGGDIVVDADGQASGAYFEVHVELPDSARVLHGATIVGRLPANTRSLFGHTYQKVLRFIDDAQRVR